MHIAAKLQDMFILIHYRGPKTSVKNMTAAIVLAAIPHRIGGLKPLHKTAQISAGCFQNQMNVIDHQTILIAVKWARWLQEPTAQSRSREKYVCMSPEIHFCIFTASADLALE